MPEDFEIPGLPPEVGSGAEEVESDALPATETPQVEAKDSTEPAAPEADAAPVDHAGGLPPATQSMDELRHLQEAQAAHAFVIQVEDLSRRFPIVRELRDRLTAAEKELAKHVKKRK